MTKKRHREQTVAAMVELNVYSPEYDRIIDIYADLLDLYDKTMKQYRQSRFAATIDAGNGGQKANPTIKAIEAIRRDIMAYSDRLGLSPKAQDLIQDKYKIQTKAGKATKESTLAKVLSLHG